MHFWIPCIKVSCHQPPGGRTRNLTIACTIIHNFGIVDSLSTSNTQSYTISQFHVVIDLILAISFLHTRVSYISVVLFLEARLPMATHGYPWQIIMATLKNASENVVDMATPVCHNYCLLGKWDYSQSKKLHSASLCAIVLLFIANHAIIPCHGTYVSNLKVHKGSHPTCYVSLVKRE